VHAARLRDPRRQIVHEQFRDIGARHDDALVHVKAEFAEPGFARKIRGGLALAYASLHQRRDFFRIARGDRYVPLGRVERQAERMQNEVGCFVASIRGAMSV
jgi:hypothetical protein